MHAIFSYICHFQVLRTACIHSYKYTFISIILHKWSASRNWKKKISCELISLFIKMKFMEAQQLKMLYSYRLMPWRQYRSYFTATRRISIIGASIFLELNRFIRAARINDQGAGDLSSMLCPDQLSYHIASWQDFKFQCQWNYNTSLRNCQTWSSSIQGNLISFNEHWYSSATLSRLIVFLQLQH